MSRTIPIVAAFIVVIGIAVTFWIIRDPSGTPQSTKPDGTASQQFDTTGGREMRLRWNQGEGQGDDATNR